MLIFVYIFFFFLLVSWGELEGFGQNKKAARVGNPAASGEKVCELFSSQPHWAAG